MSRYRPHRSLGRRAVIRLLHYWAKRQFNDEKRCKYQERIDALLVALLLALSVRDDFSAIPFQTVKSPPAPIELSGGGWQRFPEGVKLTASASQQATTLTRHFKAYASHLRIDTLQRLIEVMTCSPKTDPPENGMSGTIGEPSPEVSMKGKKHTEEQIAFALNQAETGVSVGEICRKMGIAESTFYHWKKKFSGLGVTELRRLRQLEDENRKLKQLVADLSLDKIMLQDVILKRMTEIAQTRVRYGYRRIHILMQREGWRINHKRLQQLVSASGPESPDEAASPTGQRCAPRGANRSYEGESGLVDGFRLRRAF